MEEIKSDFIGMTILKKYLSISVGKIHDLMKNDKLPYYRFGRKYFFKLQEIDEFFKTKKLQ